MAARHGIRGQLHAEGTAAVELVVSSRVVADVRAARLTSLAQVTQRCGGDENGDLEIKHTMSLLNK